MEDLGIQIHPSHFRTPKMTSDTSDAEELRITIRRRSLSLRRRHHGLGEGRAVPAPNAGFLMAFFNGKIMENPLSIMEIHGNC